MTRLRRALPWALLAALWLVPLSAVGIIDPTEARYAEIAREMVASRDFVIPRLDGLPHFDKPPGAYWALAAGIAALGNNEWGARVPVAVAALLTLALTARIAGLLGAGRSTTLWILAASPLFFALFHLASADPFLTGAVTGFHAAYLDPRRRTGLLPFAALGLGFLIKGPPVFVATVLPAIAAAAWTRRWDMLRPLVRPVAWLAFAAIALPWYLYVVWRVPGLAPFLLGHEFWQRFATTAHHRLGPPYYFLVVLALGALPWTPAMVRGIAHRLRGSRRDFEGAAILAWTLVPLVLFSFSGSKLPGYILPALPALAIAGAWGLDGAKWPTRWAPALVAAFALVPWGIPGRDETAGSVRPVARYLEEHLDGGHQVYECGPFHAGLPFYRGETVSLIDVQRDVRFATPDERSRTFGENPAGGLVGRTRVWVFGDEHLARRRIPDAFRVQVEYRWRKYVLLSAVPKS